MVEPMRRTLFDIGPRRGKCTILETSSSPPPKQLDGKLQFDSVKSTQQLASPLGSNSTLKSPRKQLSFKQKTTNSSQNNQSINSSQHISIKHQQSQQQSQQQSHQSTHYFKTAQSSRKNSLAIKYQQENLSSSSSVVTSIHHKKNASATMQNFFAKTVKRENVSNTMPITNHSQLETQQSNSNNQFTIYQNSQPNETTINLPVKSPYIRLPPRTAENNPRRTMTAATATTTSTNFHPYSQTQLQILSSIQSSSSKYSQTYLDQYLEKAQLIDLNENKQYDFSDTKNFKNDLMGIQPGLSSARGTSSAPNQLFPTTDTLHLNIISATKSEIFTFSSHNFYYFTVFMRAKPSPLNLSIKIKSPNEGYQNKLKGFISKTANRPNTFNSDSEFDGRSFRLYAEGGKKSFNFDNIFFSLYPEIDMTVKIKISFGEMKTQMNEAYINYKKQKQKIIDDFLLQQSQEKIRQDQLRSSNNDPKQSLFDLTSSSVFFSPPASSGNIQSQNRFMRDRQSQFKDRNRNILFSNKHNMLDRFDKFQKLLKRKDENLNKQNEVLERKQQITTEKWSDVEEKNRVSSLRSQFQMEKRKLVERNSKFQLWQLVWLKIIKSINVLSVIQDKFDRLKKRKRVCNQAKFIAIRAIADWIKVVRKFGQYPEKRVICFTEILTNKFAQMISQKCTRNAEQIICHYLTQNSKISDLKNKGNLVIARVIAIQRQWRETKLKKKRFKELIVRQFQSKYCDYLYEIRQEIKRQKDPFYQPPPFGVTTVKIKDYVLLSEVIQRYLDQHLRKYYDMYESYRRSVKLRNMGTNEEIRKNLQITMALQKPSFFRLPKENELKMMVREYADKMQLLN